MEEKIMTKLEERFYIIVIKYLPIIADALINIAKNTERKAKKNG